jgi:hypothetical protein
VPKDIRENLLFRQRALEIGASSGQAAHDLWKMCARDLLFYVNTFCWLYEPRRRQPIIPFVTFPFQDEALLEIEAAIADHDLCIKKSRDGGASWMCVTVFAHRWQFFDMQSFLLVSRTQDMVDKADDPDCLFWKALFLLDHQPTWLRPRYTHTELRLTNNYNGSTISGASTTGNVGRGGRRTGVLCDEYAAFPVDDGYRALFATQAVTNCRIWNSTPQGTGNAYHEVAHDENIRQLVLPWWNDPRKNAGLYSSDDGKLRLVDEDYWLADAKRGNEYDFILDGKLRSPWYDAECNRTPVPQLIAQEIDMDFLGSNFQFFNKAMLDKHEREYARPAFAVGELGYDLATGEPDKFEPGAGAERLELWVNLNAEGKPPYQRPHVIGADISAGTGASNSCLTVADAQTGEKVAAFVSPHIAPHELAVYAIALGKWFANADGFPALIIAEANGGHNRQFQKQVINHGYEHLYYRRSEQSVTGKVTNVPGWGSTKDNKRELLEEYGRALGAGDFVNRSKLAIGEGREYVYFPDGTVDHARGRNVLDPSGAKENHGDRVIADALAWHGMRHQSHRLKDREPEIPVGSVAWRMQEHAGFYRRNSGESGWEESGW